MVYLAVRPFGPLFKFSLRRIALNFLSNFNESSILVITSKFLSMYLYSSVSTVETPTLNSTKSLSKVFAVYSKSWCPFLWNAPTIAVKDSIIGAIPSRLWLPRVLNYSIVPNSSMSLTSLLWKRSNLPKIWLVENSNCFPFGIFMSLSLVNSYYFW